MVWEGLWGEGGGGRSGDISESAHPLPQPPPKATQSIQQLKKQRDQERHKDQCKENPRHPANLTAPRDPPRYPFLCLCALCGFAHQKLQRPRQRHPIKSTIKEHRDQDGQRDQGKANPRYPVKPTVPRDPPQYAFWCLCALPGSCVVGCVLWVVCCGLCGFVGGFCGFCVCGF